MSPLDPYSPDCGEFTVFIFNLLMMDSTQCDLYPSVDTRLYQDLQKKLFIASYDVL